MAALRGLPARWRQWWHARLPLTDTLTLTQRNVYILPTRAGWLLAATLVVLLVASINYQLNLGYLLTFLLAGCALVGMHVTHATLRGLQLTLEPPQPQFAGAGASLGIVLVSELRRTRHGIGLRVREGAGADNWVWCDVAPQAGTPVRVGFAATRRGLHPVPAITLETRYPLGTFRVWTVWRPAARVLVWPAPESPPPPLPPGEPRGGSGPARVAFAGEFEGVRAYRTGDPLRGVVWKKAARTGELVSRDTQQARRHELWLDYAQAGPGDVEQRLSRLAAWVLQADRLGLDFGLRVPGKQLEPGRGEAHKRRCLEVLALC
ncbi:DUF58 domain-containing protein [Ramlibacter rhizophilus]|uniref:DUF58 domain-containing protein n=1 Tax=Ramlibacter rhizophilus TaxID=1781167 RepID=A0A4Z0BCV1_9BURK|nr:DUF58 domain-containing protein [Ramlibacter rhizophilus]TFY96570.1 DUF58 domain-containing protein [Ramlibacter rhizophilus]